MKRLIILVAACIVGHTSQSQVGIGNTDPKSSLDITATNVATPSNTDGILIPRIDDFPVSDPGVDQDGMLVFVTGNGTPSEGFYYWDQGTMSWVSVGGATSDSDWYEVGTNNPADDISDNIYHLGNLAVGGNSTSTTSPLLVQGDVSTDLSNILTSVNGAFPSGTYFGMSNSGVLTGAGNYTGISNSLAGSNDGTIRAVSNSFLNSGTGQKIGIENTFNSADGVRKGFRNYFSAGNSISMGLENVAPGAFSISGALYGLKNDLSSGGNGQRYGVQTVINTTGSGSKYGEQIIINSSAGGQHYGVYSDVQKPSGYAGYFIGRTSLGTDPSTGRYLMPAADGTTGQMITTDGSGQLSFSDPAQEDIDWYEVGTTTAPNAINDDMFTQGNVVIGATTNPANVKFYVESDPANNTTGIRQSMGAGTSGLLKGFDNLITANGTTNVYAISNSISGNSTGTSIQAIRNSFSGNGGTKTAMYNSFGAGFGGSARGSQNEFNSTSITGAIGNYNFFNSIGSTATATGTLNSASSSVSAATLFGTSTTFIGPTVSGSAYGNYSNIQTSGTDYGVYAQVADNAIDYAGYFVGRASFGTNLATGRYLLPAADGAAGQVVATDGSGQLSFVNATADTDDQTIDNFGLLGDTLGLSIEDDGQPVQTVDLSNVNFNVSNFALAKMTMSANQSLPSFTYTKVNFDSSAIAVGSNFNTTTDRFEVSEDGIYRISASVKSLSNNVSNAYVELLIYVNGSAVKRHIENHHALGVIYRDVEIVQVLTAGQYVEVYAYTDTTFTIDSGIQQTTFVVERIR
ncbi:MAG: hypothetical protein KJO05_05020 [Bacteroidia bacterium]|nr:hypothetical protein [Bacteroidia bacterium]NNF30798.1 hypothetical protein [Flavobacteriaceae bacterium]MBT8277157.1 hypothetical protein [Bacteroidia bacterium]NNJ82932.1 hypothetical protein [Flavobacteriaceae bacterium]NNK55606.1 hypothetical protein [Flavobacteriaceae bacterium]